MLNKDPTQRATVKDLMEDLWLTNNGFEPILIHEVLNTDSESVVSEEKSPYNKL